ncbi:Dps family protein [Fodinibius halophilus]|uniref:DNA starvation/stationary phase protection protein n=1 Tax=Fodinibius halophilus TaxID=1736908 RepID=A0A6M1T9T0_9BACT|nr:Dps family protein [Fodinibius halophilus]NGP88791.1 DNA starvation/stationary phase protection protein [Fodinibius halophilus]
MSKLNHIGLDKDKSKELGEKLNALLANYSIFYQNTRGYHWNIKGDTFFELHQKFEELYNDLFIKIDDVAERILTLGGTPNHNYSAYITQSVIKESKQVTDGKEAVREILNAYKSIIKLQREILELSDELGDEGTNALMSDYISEQEKKVWMYSSYISDQ